MHNKKGAKKLLRQCISLSAAQGNVLEKTWAEQSQQVWWDLNCDSQQAIFWQPQQGQDVRSAPDWHVANKMDGEITMYSLPMPHWPVVKDNTSTWH